MVPLPPNPPSTNPPNAPVTTGQVTAGKKLDTLDLQALLLGGYPGELMNGDGTTPDYCIFPAVPDGFHRVIQHATCNTGSGVGTAALFLQVIRNGVTYELAGCSHYPIADDAPVNAKGILLKPGDVLQFTDKAVAGGTLVGSIMYVDVYL